LIGSGSPNDIGADIRSWLTTAAERRTLVTIKDPLLKDLAGTLETTLVQLIERARQTAQQALEPERQQLDVERREFEKQRLTIEALQRQIQDRNHLVDTLRNQLELERALRSAAEEERTAIHAQRDGVVQRLTLAEERLTALPGLKKENAKLQSEVAKRAADIERLRARVDAQSELRVKQELAQRDLSHQRERTRELERRLAQATRKLDSANQKLAVRKQGAIKKAKGRARVAAKRARA
jgi:predicted RNase H-like nuclease (RuvC/YqgF family)